MFNVLIKYVIPWNLIIIKQLMTFDSTWYISIGNNKDALYIYLHLDPGLYLVQQLSYQRSSTVINCMLLFIFTQANKKSLLLRIIIHFCIL